MTFTQPHQQIFIESSIFADFFFKECKTKGVFPSWGLNVNGLRKFYLVYHLTFCLTKRASIHTPKAGQKVALQYVDTLSCKLVKQIIEKILV